MKLIASNKDYYDHFARDRNVSDQAYVWERQPKVVVVDFAIPPLVRAGNRGLDHLRRRQGSDFDAVGFVVFFCGRPVPVVKVTTEHWTSFGCTNRKVECFYTFDDLPAFVKGEEPGKYSRYGKRRWRNLWQQFEDLFAIGGEHGWERHEIDGKAFSGRVLPKIPIDEMHRRVNSPVFCHHSVLDQHDNLVGEAGIESRLSPMGLVIPSKPCVLINPVLSHIDFHRRIDAFQAFLDIERYLTNNLAPRDVKRDKSIKDNPVPDKIKAESHGFDKWSFRKEPSKSRKR